MSNPYLEFVSAIVAKGREAILEARSRGITSQHLRDVEAALAYSNILDYVTKYDGQPTAMTIEGETGVELPPPPAQPAEYWIDKIQEIRLLFRLQESHGEVGDLITAEKPKEAYEKLETTLKDYRSEGLSAARVTPLFGLLQEVYDHYLAVKGGLRGVPFPWPMLNDDTLGMHPEDLILFVARTGVGKCVHADSEIVDPVTGVPSTIEEIYRAALPGSRITTWAPDRGIVDAPITAAHDTGSKECLRFDLGTGRSITVTPEHPFLTPEGWKRADEIAPGGTVGIPSRMPEPIRPQELPQAEADVLALELSRQHGVHKTIPDAVWRMPRRQLERFLSLFWMCGGYVDATGPCLVLGSERMLRQIQSLLLRLGVQSSVNPKPVKYKGGMRDSWRLRVYASSWGAFASAIVLWGDKGRALGQLYKRTRNSNVGFPVVSQAARDAIVSLAGEERGRWTEAKRTSQMREVALRLGRKAFSPRDLFKRRGTGYAVSLKGLRAYTEVLGTTDYDWLWGSDLLWDSVTDITDVGVQKIYDLTVELTSCFVANDVLVHNTWVMTLLALHAFQNERKVLFATTELSQRTIATRFFSLYFGVPYDMIRKGHMTMFDEDKFQKAIQELLGEAGIDVIGGDFDFRIESLEAAIEESKPDVVILDGAYLLQMEGHNRVEKAANAFNELKRLAKRQKVPIVITWQFNREAKKSKSSGGAGYAIESISLSDVGAWNSDMILAIWQDDEMKQAKQMGLKHLKDREGVGRDFKFNWDFNHMSFTEIQGGGDADDANDIDDPVF